MHHLVVIAGMRYILSFDVVWFLLDECCFVILFGATISTLLLLGHTMLVWALLAGCHSVVLFLLRGSYYLTSVWCDRYGLSVTQQHCYDCMTATIWFLFGATAMGWVPLGSIVFTAWKLLFNFCLVRPLWSECHSAALLWLHDRYYLISIRRDRYGLSATRQYCFYCVEATI